MSEREHVAILREGCRAWNSWRKEVNGSVRPDLSAENLAGADLSGFDLSASCFDGACLKEATLDSANLEDFRARGADMRRANLRNTLVDRFDLQDANIQWADFRGARGLKHRVLWKAVNAPLAYYDPATVSALGLIRPPEQHASRLDDGNLQGYRIASFDLTGADLSGWNLSGAVLDDCILTRAALVRANLTSCQLVGALLEGADLTGANLTKASLYFAVLRASRLKNANLEGADVRIADFHDCDLDGANCEGVAYAWRKELNELRKSKSFLLASYSADLCAELGLLDDHKARLAKRRFDAYRLSGANFAGIHLEGADFSGADCRSIVLTGAFLAGANLEKADLCGANLDECDLRGARLSAATLNGASLRGALLDGAVLAKASLPGAVLLGADLANADLRDADLREAALRGARIENANLQGANLELATSLDGPSGIDTFALPSARGYRLARYSDAVLLEFSLDPLKHRENVILKSFEGYDFSRSNLCEADLSLARVARADFRNAMMRGARLAGADARGADFRGANLAGSDFSNCVLDHARFRNADLHDADLRESRGLVSEQLAATRLTGARLPPEIATFTGLNNIKEVSTSARGVFIAMLLLSIYSWLQIVGTRDYELIASTSSVSIPLMQVQLTVASFFLTVPLLLAALYVWCHFYLQHLWEELSKLPAIFPDGRPLFRRVHPWLLNTMVSAHFPILQKNRPLLTHLQTFAGVLLAWWMAPLTIAGLWWRYLCRHDLTGSIVQAILAGTVAIGGLGLQSLAGATMRGKRRRPFDPRQRLRQHRFWFRLVGALSIMAVFFAITIMAVARHESSIDNPVRLFFIHRTAAQMAGADISQRRSTWKSGKDADKDQVNGALLAGKDMHYAMARKAFVAAADLRRSHLEHADFEAADLRWSDMRGAFLTGTDFASADLRGTDLRGAHLSRTDLNGARLDDADLKGVDLRSAIGLTKKQLASAKTDSTTRKPF